MILALGIIAVITATEGFSLCPKEDLGLLLPHETNCVKYYECKQGIKIEKRCPAGLYFDILEKQCLFGKCKENFNTYRLQFFLHEKHCHKYYMVIKNKKIEYACPSGLHFNLESEVCDHPELVNCPLKTLN